jgi:pectate lyase
MIFLLLGWAGIVSLGLGGCTDGIIQVFRPAPVDAGADAAVDAPTMMDADAAPRDAAPPDAMPITCPPTKLVGYAAMGGGTTGGGDAGVLTATTLDQLRMYAGQPGPAIVRISGTIAFSNDVTQVEVASDKTIVPAKIGDGLTGNGLIIKEGIRNVIVRNLTITKALSPYDAISVQAATNVWIDHCDLSSDRDMPKGIYDGLLDITHGSSNVTVSWNYLHDHYNPSLVGHTDTVNTEDPALAVTFHHNLFRRFQSGAPRARFGHVHIFNNHYDTVDMYSIASVMGATLLVERNVFDAVAMPLQTRLSGADLDGTIQEFDDLTNPNSGPSNITTAPNTWRPPYSYTDSFDLNTSVAIVVDTCAGVGKVP